jgi:transglutaminase-like putative cysteine protease
LLLVLGAMCAKEARASSDAPAWLRNLTNVSLPAHDEKTDAILLYSEEFVSVQANGKVHRTSRNAYKILRPEGRKYATVWASSNDEKKILKMRAWCITVSGKEYEVKDKDATETSAAVMNGELASDVRVKRLGIPDGEPGNIVGSEVEKEESLFVLQDEWEFQESVPVREARYSLSLPPGWEYKTMWVNAPETNPTPSGTNEWLWVVSDVKEIRYEQDMPFWSGVAGHMILSLIPPGGSKKGFLTWSDLAKWQDSLYQGRRDASPEIKQKVVELTAGKADTFAKMQAVASYMQRDVRYVAVELGIGGWQPHQARDVYSHQYGDCKDKATLMSTMLKEVGIDSYYVVVNVYRGTVNANAPTKQSFNHVILAIHLPDGQTSPDLRAVYVHPVLGRLLIFDPTDEMTPLGFLRGPLQGNYALLVASGAGELVQLPILPAQNSGVRRGAQFALSATGALSGEVTDMRYGDAASRQRLVHRDMTKKEDQIKPIETILSHAVGSYQITKATIGNLDVRDQPFQYKYSFIAPSYAKTAGDLLLVRLRVIGEESSDILEKKEPRKYPIEFYGPRRDNDRVEIKLPEGYVVDELPPATDVEYSFGSYHSKVELKGNALVYARTYEIKEVSIPLEKMEDLKKFYRMIASDERGTAVLKPAPHTNEPSASSAGKSL